MLKSAAIAFIFFIASYVSFATGIFSQNVIWANYDLKWKINDQWSLATAGDERRFISPYRKHMFLGSVSGTRSFANGIQLTAWLTWARFTLPHDPEISKVMNRREIRPNVAIQYQVQGTGKWKFSYRFRVEERFFQAINSEGRIQKDHYEFRDTRFRMRFLAQYPFSEKTTLIFSDEFMLNTPRIYAFDQNRVSLTLKHQLTDHVAISYGYLNWFQKRQIEEVDKYFNRNSYLITFHYSK